MEWIRMDSNGMDSNGIECNGMKSIGIECNGMEWNLRESKGINERTNCRSKNDEFVSEFVSS